MRLLGQFEPIIQMKLVHARACTQLLMAYYGPSQAHQQRSTVSTFRVRLAAERMGPHEFRVKKEQYLPVGLCMKIYTISVKVQGP